MSQGNRTTHRFPENSRDPPADQLQLDLTGTEDETFEEFMHRMRDPAENPQTERGNREHEAAKRQARRRRTNRTTQSRDR